ncbi:MAG: hypothetical protein ACOC1U_03080, partial [Spirochaetota bacterium]
MDRARRNAFRPALVVLMLALAAGASAQGVETDELGARVEALYLGAGIAMPSVSRPASERELLQMLRLLAAWTDDEPIAARARRLAREIRARADDQTLLVDFALTPEYYAGIDRGDFRDQVRVESPFAELSLGYGIPIGPAFVITAALQREWSYSDAPTNVPRPIDGNPLPFENNFVTEGYLSLPVGLAEVTFGRQNLSIGPDPENTLSISSRIPYLDALRTTLSFGRLKMTWVVSTLENGRARLDPALPPDPTDPLYGFDSNTIFYNIHYFEYAWPSVRVGIGSQVVLARRMNTFHLGDFFPVFSWHNADITPNNMSLLADVTVSPAERLDLFFQLGLDDISGEAVGVSDSAVPTIDAYVLGARYSLPALGLSAAVTGGSTHYLWGNFDDDDYLARVIYRMETDGPRPSLPLTSPYGPGVLWADARVGARYADLTADLRYIVRGELPGVDLYSLPYAANPSLES